MAMMLEAPEMRAPWMALNPKGPHPTTATMEPGPTAANTCEAVQPRPATLTQLQTIPRSAADALVKTGTTHSSNVTISSARPPMCELA
jgi:hypothetical protein